MTRLSILLGKPLGIIAFFILVAVCPAEPIRVSTWAFQPPAPSTTSPETYDSQIEAAANALKPLDPEVILLQGVRDWTSCQQLSRALKPADYKVLGCSSFTDSSSNAPFVPQVAILSKQKAYFFWSEPWAKTGRETKPGGFGFAAIQIRSRRLGVFSVQVDPQQMLDVRNGSNSNSSSRSIQQWVHTFNVLRNWETNRIEAAVVAGAVEANSSERPAKPRPKVTNSSASFLAMGLTRATIQPGFGNRAESRTNYFAAHFIPGLEGLSGVVMARSSATCDLDFDGVMPPIVASDAPVEAGPQTSPTFPGGPTNASWWIAGVISALIAATMLGWFLARGRARSASTAPALIAEYVEDESRAAGSFTVTVGPKSVTGSALGDAGSASELRPVVSLDAPEKTRTQSEVLPARILNPGQRRQHHDNVHAGLVSTLSQWLKQKLVRRLIADRANLVATQQASTLKVMKVDERLARIEAQLRDQNRAYERRIELLTAELSAAKEENRELIRAQIMKVKAEMEAARAKLVAETNDPAE